MRTQDALQILKADLSKQIESYHAALRLKHFKVPFRLYGIHFIVIVYCLYHRLYRPFLHSSLLTILSIYCEHKQWRLFSTESFRKLIAARTQLEASIGDASCLVYSRFSELRNESLHLFRVKRDGSLVELPDILLVRGDEVYVSTEDEFQALSQLIEPICGTKTSFPRFVTLSTSKFVPLLESCMAEKQSKANWIDSKMLLMRNCTVYLMLFALFIASIRNKSECFFRSTIYFFVFYPVPWVFLLRCYANSRIIVLWDLLKRSQNPYDDIDEFDEDEPPPTIDLYVPLRLILHVMHSFLCEATVGFDICDSLSLISFVAYTDRCGTLCDKYPKITKILVFSESSLLEPDIVLDTVPFEGGTGGFQFEDRGWTQFQASLKPLGLCTSLIGTCMLESRDIYHKIDTNKYEWIKSLPTDQICFCSLAKVLGFQPADIGEYEPLKYIVLKMPAPRNVLDASGTPMLDDQTDTCDLDCGSQESNQHKNDSVKVSVGTAECETIDSCIISLKLFQKENQVILICEGSPTALLPFATKYWNGVSVMDLDAKIKKKTCNFTNSCDNSDTYNSAFAFKLLPLEFNALLDAMLAPGISPKTHNNNSDTMPSHGLSVHLVDQKNENYSFFLSLIRDSVLVGVLGLSFEPKEDISAFIDDLEQAGIRFVYFSPNNQKSTKAFGDRLGLDTDWNSCILLNEPNSASNGKLAAFRGYIDLKDINARLPQGPEQIRHHLENVDDIPLHVSLFANAYDNMGKEIKELFRIFHEQGETVCLVGNCLNSSNFFLFNSADVAIGMESSNVQDSEKPGPSSSDSCSSVHLANILISTFCSLDGLPFKSSPYILTEIIREGRSLLDVSFQIISYLSAIGISVVVYCSVFSVDLSNLWGVVAIAAVAVAFLGNAHDAKIMRFLPAKKNEDETKIYLFNPRRLVSYFLIKCATFILCYAILSNWLKILALQLISSASYLHRNVSLRYCFASQPNYYWLTVLLLILCPIAKFWIGWRIAAAFFLNLFVNELCKKHDRVNWIKTQRRLKLEFNTRLGMHSPV